MLESSQMLNDLDNSSMSIYDNQVESEVLNKSANEAYSSTSISHGTKEGV
jgi:hypothetical protein